MRFRAAPFGPCGDKAARCFGPFMVAAGHDDAHPVTGEAQRGIKPDPRTGAGHDRHTRRGIADCYRDASLSQEVKDSCMPLGLPSAPSGHPLDNPQMTTRHPSSPPKVMAGRGPFDRGRAAQYRGAAASARLPCASTSGKRVTAGPSAAAWALVRSQVRVGGRWEVTALGCAGKRCFW